MRIVHKAIMETLKPGTLWYSVFFFFFFTDFSLMANSQADRLACNAERTFVSLINLRFVFRCVQSKFRRLRSHPPVTNFYFRFASSGSQHRHLRLASQQRALSKCLPVW